MDAWLALALDPGDGGDGGSEDERPDEPMPAAPRLEAGAGVEGEGPLGLAELVALEAPAVFARDTEVTLAELATLLQPPGPFALTPLARIHDRVMSIASAPTARLDPEVLAIADRFLKSDDPPLLSSKAKLAEDLGVDRRDLEPKMALLANALVHVDRAAIASFVAAVRRHASNASMFLEVSRYDATQSVLTVEEHLGDFVPTTAGRRLLSGGANGGGECAASAAPRVSSQSIAKSASRCHLMASEVKYAMLVQFSDEPASRFHAFVGDALSWVQITDRSTTAVDKQAILETAATFMPADAFKLKVRCCTTDAANVNFAIERSLSDDRGESWSSLHLPCNVHRVSACTGKTLLFAEQTVSAMLNLSLSLSSSASLRAFRKALTEVVRETLVVKIGVPLPQYKQHAVACMDLFLGRGRFFEGRRDLLATVMNGDWSGPLEVWVSPTEARPSRASLVSAVVQCLIFCCCGRAFTNYPRHRWLGADAAVDEIGLIASVHSLLRPAYKKFVQLCEGQARPAQDSVVAEVGAREPARLPEVAEGVDHAAAANPPAETVAGAESPDWAATNARHRSVASTWLAQGDFHSVWIVRVVMEPLRGLMSSYMDMSGEKWETRQRAGAAPHPDAADGQPPPRVFRLTEYASMVAERRFLEALKAAWSPTAWEHMPPSGLTCAARCLAFRSLSREGCLVSAYLEAPARQFPVALFKLVHDRGLWREMHASPVCLRDEFVAAFLAAHPGEDLASDEAHHQLTLIASVLHVDNVAMELCHSRIRRSIVSAGVQTHRPTVGYMNVHHLFAQHRQRRAKHDRPGAALQVKKRQPKRKRLPPQAAQKAKRRTRGGGLCRAWMSENARGRRESMRVFHAEYRAWKALGGPDVARLKRVGELATIAHKAGGRAFGLKPRQVQRLKQKRLRDAMLRQGSSPAAAIQVARSSGRLTDSAPSVSEMLTSARAAQRLQAVVDRGADAEMAQALADFAEQHAAETVALACGRPSLAPFVSSLKPIADHGGLRCHSACFDLSSTATNVASWASANSRSSNLRSALGTDWKQKNRMITDSELLPITNTDKRTPCKKTGFCVCSEQGKQILRLRNSLLQRCKLRCPRSSPSRDLLANAFLVVRLQWRREELPLSPWLAFASCDAGSQDYYKGQAAAEGKLWAHVGFQSFSPYKQAYHLLEELPDRPGSPYTWLRATYEFAFDFDFAARLNPRAAWTLAFFTLVDTSEPLGRFDPREVPVEKMPGAGEESKLWPLERRPGRARGAGRSPRSEPSEAASDGSAEARDDANDGGHAAPQPIADGGEAEGIPDEAALEELSEGDGTEVEDFAEEALWALAAEFEDALDENLAGPADAGPEGVGDPGDGGAAADALALGAAAIPFGEGGPPLAPEAEGPPAFAHAPPAGAMADRSGPRGEPLAIVELEGASLRYDRKGGFVALCRRRESCVLTRTSREGCKPAQGRPLGLLAAWAAVDADDKEDHRGKIAELTDAVRLDARHFLAGMPGAGSLFGYERPQREGEGEEPGGLP